MQHCLCVKVREGLHVCLHTTYVYMYVYKNVYLSEFPLNIIHFLSRKELDFLFNFAFNEEYIDEKA